MYHLQDLLQELFLILDVQQRQQHLQHFLQHLVHVLLHKESCRQKEYKFCSLHVLHFLQLVKQANTVPGPEPQVAQPHGEWDRVNGLIEKDLVGTLVPPPVIIRRSSAMPSPSASMR